MKNIPNKIFLQIHGDDSLYLDHSDVDFNDIKLSNEITWCIDQIFDSDEEYLRKNTVIEILENKLKNAVLNLDERVVLNKLKNEITDM